MNLLQSFFKNDNGTKLLPLEKELEMFLKLNKN